MYILTYSILIVWKNPGDTNCKEDIQTDVWEENLKKKEKSN